MPAAARPIRAVLFDLGGTLVDERDFSGWVDLARSVYLELVPDDLAHAYAEVEAEVDRAPLGLPPPAARLEVWRRVLEAAAGAPVPEATVRRFVDGLLARPDPPVALYSDARRCLHGLAAERRRLGIVSNSTSEASVRRILHRAGILDYFERIVSSGTEGVAKPDPEIFRRAVARLGVAPAEALYVGNLPRTDALGARAAGLRSVWLHRDGTGLGDDPPEITSLLEVGLIVRQLEGLAASPEPPSVK